MISVREIQGQFTQFHERVSMHEDVPELAAGWMLFGSDPNGTIVARIITDIKKLMQYI